MSTYSVHGAAHKMLAHLDSEPATSGTLRHAVSDSKSKRRKLWRAVAALKDDGLVYCDRMGFYHLTQAGIDALTALRGGHPITVGGRHHDPRFAHDAA